MRTVLRRWTEWLAARGAADVAGVGGAIGAAAGALAGWFGTKDAGLLGSIAAAGGVGAAVGGATGLVIWELARAVRQAASTANETGEQLLAEFRILSRAVIRREWRLMLDGRDRLEAGFSVYRRIAPPRSFTGSLRHRSDLAAAVDAAAGPGAGPRLLIVGPPGYGKTVALLDIAQHLVDGHGDKLGTPVAFNLGGWSHESTDLIQWMVAELCATTGPLPGADPIVSRWISAGWIAPVLDGLDEITDPVSRQRCVLAINAFVDRSPDHTAVLVASRPDEYTEITAQGANRLAVNAAIELGTVSPSRVAVRLREIDTTISARLAELIETTPRHPAAELLCVPLWLWIAGSLTDRDCVEHVIAATCREEAQRILTDAYLARTIADLDNRVPLDEPRSRRVLAAIAGFLTDRRSPDSTTFHLEDLTPAQPSLTQIRAAALAVGTTNGLLYGMAIGLVLGPDVGGLLGLLHALAVTAAMYRGWERFRENARPARSRIQWPGTIYLMGGLLRGLWLRDGRLFRWLAFGLAWWTAIGALAGLIYGLVRGLGAGIVFGLTAGFIGFVASRLGRLGSAMLGQVMVSRLVPGDTMDEGRSASKASLALVIATIGLLTCLTAGALGLLVGKLVPGLVTGLSVGLAVGLLTGRNFGGWYLLLQRRVRGKASRDDLLPRDPASFFAAAADVGILRETGGGVQFRHRTLADRLAQEAPDPGLMDLRLRVGTEEDPNSQSS